MSELATEEKKEDVAPVMAPQAVEQAPVEQAPAASQAQDNVLLNLTVLEPGDYPLLAQTLANYPEFREQILERAAQLLGNDTVAKALQTLAGVPEPEAPSEKAAADAPAAEAAAQPQAQEAAFDYTTSPLALEYDENAKIKDHADFMLANPQVADQVLTQTAELDVNLAVQVALEYDGAAAKAKEEAPAQEQTPPQVIEETSKAAAEEVKQEAKQAEEPAAPVPAQEAVEARPVVEPEKESGWVVRAREYNAEHADEVARFLAATGGACMVDGALDPNLVAQWQSRHGVDVDGRIGEQTVEAAVKQQPQTFEEAAKEAQEEQLPEPDPTDPKFAL
jgi:hypothetical protein